jgi:anaerobic selenocysteine-containing dehydrogenase
VVKVVGAKEHPFTRGILCAKVKDYEQRTYADDRLLFPLVRVGAKGDGKFTRVSWDDAVGHIADRFSGIVAEFGAESLMPLFFLGVRAALRAVCAPRRATPWLLRVTLAGSTQKRSSTVT